MVPKLAELDYEVRLRKLRLPSLMYRRLRGDLIEMYKYTHGLYDVPTDSLLPPDENARTRGHQYKLKKQTFKYSFRRNFFSLRVTDTWNKLPKTVVSAPTMNTFKNRLDKHFGDLQYSTDFPLTAHTSKGKSGTDVGTSEDLQ